MQPKFRLICTGNSTYVELCGKTIGKGITSINFSHDENKNLILGLNIDLKAFEFMEDGRFDEVEKALKETAQEERP